MMMFSGDLLSVRHGTSAPWDTSAKAAVYSKLPSSSRKLTLVGATANTVYRRRARGLCIQHGGLASGPRPCLRVHPGSSAPMDTSARASRLADALFVKCKECVEWCIFLLHPPSSM